MKKKLSNIKAVGNRIKERGNSHKTITIVFDYNSTLKAGKPFYMTLDDIKGLIK